MTSTNPTRPFSWKKALLLSLSVGLLAAGLSAFLQTRGLNVQAFADALKSTVAPAKAAGLGASFVAPGQPARLIIPAIGVNAAVQSVGLSWKGTGAMGVPSNFTDVAWYNGGPLPGAPGSAVIDGHLDGKDVPQAVFYNLGALKPGDVVEVVDTSGKMLKFKVLGSKTYDYTAPTTDIFAGGGPAARLNLITCAGDWVQSQKLYDKRVVVFTELVTTP
jgi:sortase (surface protein transpeptidase)